MTHKLNQGDNLIIQSKGLSSTLSKVIIVDVTETTILVEYVDNPPSRQVRLSKKYFDENFDIIEVLPTLISSLNENTFTGTCEIKTKKLIPNQ